MPKQSAGLLLFRKSRGRLEVFLVHPGGPLWARKDLGVWSIPKGEFNVDEQPLAAAKREFQEETGQPAPDAEYLTLTPVRLRSGKTVVAWAVQDDIEAESIQSNTFEMEWPPRSGKRRRFPEVDKAAWFPLREALEKINPAQTDLIRELAGKLKAGTG